MSMLSIEDIKRELGKNIYVYPLEEGNIKDNSINLTASKFAWSLKTKKSIYNAEKDAIEIAPGDTALVYSKEAIYVSNKIGGSYHSKVSLVSSGLGHIGTTLDPEYLGLSLIALHNNSSDEFSLKKGKSFVSIVFCYLKTATFEKAHNNEAGQTSILQNYNDIREFRAWIDENDWTKNLRKLKYKLKQSSEFEKLKENMKEERKKHNLWVRLTRSPLAKYLTIVVGSGFIYLFSYLINNIFKLNWNMDQFIVPILAFILSFIAPDIRNKFE